MQAVWQPSLNAELEKMENSLQSCPVFFPLHLTLKENLKKKNPNIFNNGYVALSQQKN